MFTGQRLRLQVMWNIATKMFMWTVVDSEMG